MTARRRFAILFGKDGETMSKEIGIIDADLLDNGTRHPNLALMKLSAWHKAQGDDVEWWWGWESAWGKARAALEMAPAVGRRRRSDRPAGPGRTAERRRVSSYPFSFIVPASQPHG